MPLKVLLTRFPSPSYARVALLNAPCGGWVAVGVEVGAEVFVGVRLGPGVGVLVGVAVAVVEHD